MDSDYEYMTLSVKNLMHTFETRLWMIPDQPPPGVIPPTIDEIKEMYMTDMTIMQPFSNTLWNHINKEIPEGWEVVDNKLRNENIKLRTTRSNGPLGWVTQISLDCYEFQVRRLIKAA